MTVSNKRQILKTIRNISLECFIIYRFSSVASLDLLKEDIFCQERRRNPTNAEKEMKAAMKKVQPMGG